MSNKLINEQSLYLLQHAHNPVHWFPWGDEAFKLAKEQNKPVLISIGYAACHWCHVMERESFEDADIAAYMNEYFVCIKVDREEHPDVDHLYMDAIQAITGSGGWPLNVFATPDRIPFYGGTYYPPRQAYGRPSWLQVLQRMQEIWSRQPAEIHAQADQMIRYLQQASQPGKGGVETPNIDTCRLIADALLKQADKEKGGFGHAPKFPGSMAISFLLEHYHFTGYEPALQHALKSLDCMMNGGIYDQLGGGFSRYATDNNWLIPHFEKMLYDNALLIVTYCDAYHITKEEKYARIIEEIITFAGRELKHPNGGYYSSLDADSEGIEGKYYTWTWQEWIVALGSNDVVVQQYFGVEEDGNWEETNILSVAKSVLELATENGIAEQDVNDRIKIAVKKLQACQARRIRPATDDKILLSWNSLMNFAICKAAVTLNRPAYSQLAIEHMHWLIGQFEQNGELMHTWKDGKSRIPAKLDDYAYLIQALLQLGTASGNNNWILKAGQYTTTVLQHFSHEDELFFYFTSDKQYDIPVRKIDMHDAATPSANSIMANNLLLLGMCMEQQEWIARSAAMLQSAMGNTVRYPYSFSQWAVFLQRKVIGNYAVVVSGHKVYDKLRKLWEHFLPNCFFLTSEKEISDLPVLVNKYFDNKVLIFVCTEQACLPPVERSEEVLRIVKSKVQLP